MARLFSLLLDSRSWFILFILFLPSQLGYHWWPVFTKVYGFRIDYLSPALYLTDLFLIGMVITFLLKKPNRNQFQRTLQNFLYRYPVFITIFLVFIVLNCLFAPVPIIAFLKSLQIFKLGILIWYAAHQPFLNLQLITRLLGIVIAYVSLIGIAQFINQSSLDGIFWFLGERTHSFSTPGIAKSVFNNQQVLRSYSIFSHPNSFAGFLVTSLILFLHQPLISRQKSSLSNLISLVIFFLGIIALYFSFSRLAIFAFLTALIIKIVFYVKPLLISNTLPSIFTISLLFPCLFLALPFLSARSYFINNLTQQTTVQQRLLQYQQLPHLITENFFLGTGNNNYLPYLQSAKLVSPSISHLQPIHNTWWLIGVELGPIGFCFLLFLGVSLYSKVCHSSAQTPHSLIVALIVILITASADHYWWTLQQNQLLFALVLGLLLNPHQTILPSNSNKKTGLHS